MIKLSNVTKKYGNFVAVDSISMDIKQGELMVILGPSGCGKSTTLRLINKMVTISEGDILVRGKNIVDIDDVELRKSIGYVIQSIGLFPHMSVGKNIATVPTLLNWEKEAIRKRIDQMLELVGLSPEKYKEKKPAQLSGGEAQRIGVARALAADPDILLMDEPFGAVDPINRLRLQREFRQIQQNLNKTVLFVTHDVEEALLIADRICIMNHGKIIQIGTPEEISINPKNEFVKEFFKGEGILSLLSRKKAIDYVIPRISNESKSANDFNLKEVITLLLTGEADELIFKEGHLTLNEISRALRGEINEFKE